MGPGILTRYIGRRFLASLAMIIGGIAALVFVVDYIDIVRDLGQRDRFTPLVGLQLAAMRLPAEMEPILPFAFLGAALISLINLSRKLELVVARAAGVSVWGLMKAPAAVAILVGLAATFLINPVAVRLYDAAQSLKAEVRGTTSARKQEGVWFRQTGEDGPSIVYAEQASEDGRLIYGVTAYVFGPDDEFREKVVARQASFEDGYWRLTDAKVISAESAPANVGEFRLATDLRAREVESVLVGARRSSVWDLPRAIQVARSTGADVDPYRRAFNSLLAQPLLLLAMVIIAATVGLRLSRYGGTLRLVLTGVGAGFLLYVVTEIVNDLGGNGIISPVVAAWAPSILALSFGAAALFHQEDG